MQDLLLDFCHQPDIICIYKARLKANRITDSISIHKYQLLQNDFPLMLVVWQCTKATILNKNVYPN